MKIGVTGGTGFIGKYLIRELDKKNYEYIVATSRHEMCDGVKFRYSDYSQQSFEELFCECDAVVHAGFKVQESTSCGNYMDYYDNAIVTENLLNAIGELGIKKIVAASSCYVYDETVVPFKENMLLKPNNNYGISKAVMEMQIEMYKKYFGYKAIIFRISQVLGYRSYNCQGFYQMLLENSINNKNLILYEGNDLAARDYIYVKDVCNALIMGIETNSEGTYNLGMGCPTTNIELAEAYLKGFDNGLSKIEYLPNNGKKDERFWYLDISKIKDELGWKPQYTIDKMIADIKLESENNCR